MRVAVTGASGFIGSALVRFLRERGHEIVSLVRRVPAAADEAQWDPQVGSVHPEALNGADAVVHLAGEGIGEKRWTDQQRRRILDSRVQGTDTIARAVVQHGVPMLVCASAMGFYGDRGDETLTEDSPPGEDFLANVVQDWEAAADPAREAGVRVTHLRNSIVLGEGGGALPRLLPLFKMGLGGRFGAGRQWWSWVSLTDTVRAYDHALGSESLQGPVNVAAPQPLTNADFTKVLARVLHRPALVPVPKVGPWLVKGEAAVSLLYTSIRILPRALQEDGFAFEHPDLEQALRHELSRPPVSAAQVRRPRR